MFDPEDALNHLVQGRQDGDVTETDPQLAFLQELVAEQATVAGDVLEIGAHTWAIHGTIAVDGDVIMAEYDTEARARIVLDELTHGQTAL